ncbi:MAG: hypothetical protein Q7U28_05740 [Aquabacterium sp.]|nr:hypothetical protein [Aquabacterium sp.]
MLKKISLAVLLTCGLVGAQATESTPPSAGFAPFVGFGLTYGGDQIGQEIRYTDGTTSSIHGGGLVAMMAGIEYQTMNSPLSVQLSIGYHVDDTLNAKNGSVRFSRTPIEALAHWRMSDSWRLGGGLRKAVGAQTRSSGLGSGYVADQNYTASTGLVLEAEMFFSPTVSMKMRAVSEKYTPETGAKQELDGSHLGVIGVYYFK